MTASLRVMLRYASLIEADLSPPLGDPGGPCQVMKRIDDQIRNPAVKEELIDEVSHGKDLTNQEASKVYPLDKEPNAGVAKTLIISAHAQYRMDLRSVTVKDVQTALKNYAKLMNDFKAMKHPGYERMQRELASGKVEFVDPKTNLMVVFAVNGRESVNLITTYWKGKNDPKPVPPSACKVADVHVLPKVHLDEDPWAYFQRLPGTFLAPVSQLETIRARPTGIENAAKYMADAAAGKGKKRIPVSVLPNEHGKLTVLDGNSTTAIAKANGWKYLPVRIERDKIVHASAYGIEDLLVDD